jgi:hypothetical protein
MSGTVGRGLQELLGHRDGRMTARYTHLSDTYLKAAVNGDVEALSHELSERIRIGAIAIDDPALRAHVRQSLADALTINNPKWLPR